jgi:hypothetical protein
VRVVPAARYVDSDREAGQRLLDPSFDPDSEIIISDVPSSARVRGSGSSAAGTARATIVSETPQDLVVDAETLQNGFLLLADTYFPGWTATVDGRAVPLFRANLSERAVPLPPGRHEVRFSYEPPGFRLGLMTTIAAVVALLLWLGAAAYGSARMRR